MWSYRLAIERIEDLPHAHLSPETLLQLAPGVRTRFDAAGHVVLDAPDGTAVDLGPRGYAALSLFAQPLALGEAIDWFEREVPSTDFGPTMNVVNMLIEEGALVRPEAGNGPASGWADPVEHARMLHDDRRTGDYISALVAAVRPGDVVLDIGTGSGVLAVAAARSGARRVYAVEASDIADVAGRVFAANGVTEIGHARSGLVAPDRAARAGRPAGRRDHRQRAARGGDPRDHARRAPPPAETRRAADPPQAHAARAAPSPAGRRGQAARDRAGGRRALAAAVRHGVPTTARRRRPCPRQHADRGRGRRRLAARRAHRSRSQRWTWRRSRTPPCVPAPTSSSTSRAR